VRDGVPEIGEDAVAAERSDHAAIFLQRLTGK
jgi:hypothetical protein